MNGDIPIGSVVRLSFNSSWVDDYSCEEDSNNPLGCTGVITETYTGPSKEWMGVSWDNGQENMYKMEDDDLIKVKIIEVEEI